MVDRLLELMKSKNLTPSQFADEVGIQRSGMSHLISGRNKPSLEFIMKILARFPEVRPEYLLYGRDDAAGDPIRPTDVLRAAPGTLFDQAEEYAEVKPGLVETKTDSVGLKPEISEIKPEPKTQKPVRKEKGEKKIEKIVVFYDDKTFREYEPE